MTPPGTGRAGTRRVLLFRAAVAGMVGAVGLVVLAQGMAMRFHIENTEDAMAETARGSGWLLGAAVLVVAAVGMSRWSAAPAWVSVLIASPVAAGIVPALIMPGDVIPFVTAFLSAGVAVIGLTATVVSAACR